MLKNVNYSYWELKEYFKRFDLVVIGSGIVGLNAAISLKKRNKKAEILVLERGLIPTGASTKNAGFACFGSPSELLDDLSKMAEEKVWETVKMRWRGLHMLEKRLGKTALDLQWNGGIELFSDNNSLERCLQKLPFLNKALKRELKLEGNFVDWSKKTNAFGKVIGSIKNKNEGQIDTSKMMRSLLKLAHSSGINILNGVHVKELSEGIPVKIETNIGEFSAKKVIVATNGFAAELLKIKDVRPARAQVLVTKKIRNLKIKGCYHYDEGYFYFREVDGRILFGGGRNLDLETENTSSFDLNLKIQNKLDQLLKEMILPGIEHEIEQRWTGILGIGSEKKPIIEFVSPNVIAAVRMGGMGVAIGTLVGDVAAQKCHAS
jgi:gamma-glutamylputrescine oxidase